jgi:hypothetical protein
VHDIIWTSSISPEACSDIRYFQLAASFSEGIHGEMALLVDKLRPRSLESLTYHKDLSERLASLVGLVLLQLLGTLAEYDFRPPPLTFHTSSSSDHQALARKLAS